MKKMFLILLVVAVSFAFAASGTASKETRHTEMPEKLSSLDDDELLCFLTANGVTVEKGGKTYPELARLFAQELEEDIFATCKLNSAFANRMFVGIRNIMLADGDYTCNSVKRGFSAPRYTLLYSQIYSWNSSTMPSYNCYAYALGRTDDFYEPGDFCGGEYNDAASIQNVATVVKEDLKALGHVCVKIRTTKPSSLGSWSKLIAVRKDTTYDFGGINDFHFARYISSTWRHKPGGTAVLTFINAPSNSNTWTNENYDGTSHQGSVTYDSNLRFLLYKNSHGSTTYEYTGQNYHAGNYHYFVYGYKCEDCGDYASTVTIRRACSGNPCIDVQFIKPECAHE